MEADGGVTAVFTLWKLGDEIVPHRNEIIIFIIVWAFLGIIFDGAGNFIYNKPFEYLCPAETVLVRDAVQEEDYEGNTQTKQYFSCYSTSQKKVVKELSTYLTYGIRFLEYIAIGFVLLGIYWLILRFRTLKK